MPIDPKRRWRPRLWAVVLLVLGLVLCLPFAGLFLFKFYANQLVQQTEESLLSQAAILSALYEDAYSAALGQEPSQADENAFAPVFPSLSLSADAILPPRPDAKAVTKAPTADYRDISAHLSRVADAAQLATLAGYRFVDPQGTVIGGSAELGVSLAHVSEIASALGGQTTSVARVRIRPEPEPALYNLSRGTRVRVFVAMPAIVNDEVIGAVYVSRTPNHVFRFLYGERSNLAKAVLFVAVSTGLIGFVFWRFITRPIHGLIRRTQASADGRWEWQPMDRFGTREIETLSASFQALTQRLQSQQDALRSYTAHVTHELKSPLTSAKGAAELLRDDDMTAPQRLRFLSNIEADIARMEALLEQMRAFSLADQMPDAGPTDIAAILADLRAAIPSVTIETDRNETSLPLSEQALTIILTHLVDNARLHGATRVGLDVSVRPDATMLLVSDNGRGITAGNRDKVFTPFFTTRRDQGGTGMGLNIVASIVDASNGRIELRPSETGATFAITFPKEDPAHP